LTQKEAKVLALEVHQYLVEHPEITDKKYLPSNLWDKIKNLHNICPLCEACFAERNEEMECPECPLKGYGENGYCRSWSRIKTIKERKKYAQLVVGKVSVWEPKD